MRRFASRRRLRCGDGHKINTGSTRGVHGIVLHVMVWFWCSPVPLSAAAAAYVYRFTFNLLIEKLSASISTGGQLTWLSFRQPAGRPTRPLGPGPGSGYSCH